MDVIFVDFLPDFSCQIGFHNKIFLSEISMEGQPGHSCENFFHSKHLQCVIIPKRIPMITGNHFFSEIEHQETFLNILFLKISFSAEKGALSWQNAVSSQKQL